METTIFGIGHILYLAITTIIMVVALVLIKRFCKTKRSQNIAIYVAAGLLLALIFVNRISIAVITEDWRGLIPISFCGLTSLLLSTSVLVVRNRNHPIFHFLAYLAYFGGIAATIYPDFMTHYTYMHDPRVISGLLHHTVAFFVVALLVMLGRFKPTLRRWYCIPLGLAVYMTMGLFFIHAAGVADAMLINTPLLPGLYWYVTGAIFLGIHWGGLVAYELIKKRYNIVRCKRVAGCECNAGDEIEFAVETSETVGIEPMGVAIEAVVKPDKKATNRSAKSKPKVSK